MDKPEGRQRRAWPGVASTIPDRIYGPQGQILLDRSVDGPSIGTFGTTGASADLHLRSPQRYLFSEARSNNHQTGNAYFDSVTGQWNRFDTAQPAIMWDVTPTSQAIALYQAAAGANPFAWNPIGELDAVGGLFQLKGGANTTQVVYSGLYAYLAGNIYYDGVNWNLYDTTNTGSLWRVGPDGQMVIWTASAGANPRPLTLVGAFLPATLGMAMNPPGAHVYATVNTTCNHATVSPVQFSTVIQSRAGQASASPWNAGSPFRLTAPVQGTYAIGGCVLWNTSATGVRMGLLRINGGTIKGGNSGPSTTTQFIRNSVSLVRPLLAGDYIEMCGYQDSGVAVQVVPSGEEMYMYMNYMGPG
jgi:hypothetical protein